MLLTVSGQVCCVDEETMFGDELMQRYEAWQLLYGDVDGGRCVAWWCSCESFSCSRWRCRISQDERARRNVKKQSAFTYGEVEFGPFTSLLQSVSPAPGQSPTFYVRAMAPARDHCGAALSCLQVKSSTTLEAGQERLCSSRHYAFLLQRCVQCAGARCCCCIVCDICLVHHTIVATHTCLVWRSVSVSNCWMDCMSKQRSAKPPP